MPQGRAKNKILWIAQTPRLLSRKAFSAPRADRIARDDPRTPRLRESEAISLLPAPIFVLRLLNSKVRFLPFAGQRTRPFPLGRALRRGAGRNGKSASLGTALRKTDFTA